MAVTPYMCTTCGKAHETLASARNCDHKKEAVKPQPKAKAEEKKTEI